VAVCIRTQFLLCPDIYLSAAVSQRPYEFEVSHRAVIRASLCLTFQCCRTFEYYHYSECAMYLGWKCGKNVLGTMCVSVQ
jgi:hypothetical protein